MKKFLSELFIAQGRIGRAVYFGYIVISIVLALIAGFVFASLHAILPESKALELLDVFITIILGAFIYIVLLVQSVRRFEHLVELDNGWII